MKSSEFLELIVETVIKENDKQTKLNKKQHKDWRLRNTSLLLKNYKKLRVHCDSVIDDLEVYKDMVFDPNGLRLDTLTKYKIRTAKMLRYFETIFKAYGDMSKSEGYAADRRYKIIRRLYIDEQASNAQELSQYFNVDRSTVTRDINKAIEDLSIMLFGIDSFEDLE